MPTDHMSHIPAMIQQYKEKKKDIKLQIISVYFSLCSCEGQQVHLESMSVYVKM